MSKKNVLFIGGDSRQLYCAKNLLDEGYEISIYGFDKYEDINSLFMNFKVLKIAIILADAIVLPTPFLHNDYLYMPFCEERIKPSEILKHIDNTKIVFGSSFGDDFRKKLEDKGIRYVDFLEDESLAVLNAELTAEGAVNIICNSLKRSVSDNKILVLGFGRISKNITRILSAFRCKTTVGARKKSDLTWAKLFGTQAKEIKHINYSDYDIVINTVPAPLLSVSLIEENKSVLFLDLAPSFSCLCENYICATALPGKYAPESAGKNLADVVKYNLEGKNNE